MTHAQFKLQSPIEVAALDNHTYRISLGDNGMYCDVSDGVFHCLFEPYVEPVKESAFMRARRLQIEAIEAAQEAANEAAEAGKRFKELFDHWLHGG